MARSVIEGRLVLSAHDANRSGCDHARGSSLLNRAHRPGGTHVDRHLAPRSRSRAQCDRTRAAPVLPRPESPAGQNDAATEAFETITATIPTGLVGSRELQAFIDAGDARHAWLVSDLLRFISAGAEAETLIAGFEALTGADVANDEQIDRSPWNVVTNRLIAWDTPAPPDYQRLKGAFSRSSNRVGRRSSTMPDADIDWRWVSWGGVFIDDRPLGDR